MTDSELGTWPMLVQWGLTKDNLSWFWGAFSLLCWMWTGSFLPAFMLWTWEKPAWRQTQHVLVEHRAEKYKEKPNTTGAQLCLGVCPTCRWFDVYFHLSQSSFQITWETEKNANSGLQPRLTESEAWNDAYGCVWAAQGLHDILKHVTVWEAIMWTPSESRFLLIIIKCTHTNKKDQSVLLNQMQQLYTCLQFSK